MSNWPKQHRDPLVNVLCKTADYIAQGETRRAEAVLAGFIACDAGLDFHAKRMRQRDLYLELVSHLSGTIRAVPRPERKPKASRKPSTRGKRSTRRAKP